MTIRTFEVFNIVYFQNILANCVLIKNTISHNRTQLTWKHVKQFVVTNCSKEQPSSIVIKTLKNGIFMPIVTSTESHFNADFKYISFIKIGLTRQKLRA